MTPMAVFIFFFRILTSMLYPYCFTDSPATTLHRGLPPLIEMVPKIEKKDQNCIRVVLCCKDSNLISIHTSYLTDSYIGFTLKMEYVCNQEYHFWAKITVKSYLKKFILKSLHAGR